jgi:YD repeat-containing protein
MRSRRLSFWQGLIITTLACLLSLAVTEYCLAQTGLTLGVPYSDSLSSYGEEKFYRVNVSAGQHLFVMLAKDNSWSSYLYIKYGALPTTSDYDSRISGSSDLALGVPTTQAGYYYIMVRSTSSSGGTYNITANNNSTLATLTIGSSTSDTLSWDGDKQYYQLNASAGQHLFFILEKSKSWYCKIYVKHGNLPTSSDYDAYSRSSIDQALDIPTTQAGYYYVMVESDYSSGGSYTVTPRTSLDELSIGTPTSGTLSWDGDKQYYQLNASAGQHLFFILEKTQSWYCKIYIKHGNLPTSSDYDAYSRSSIDQALDIPTTQAGYYYVMVESDYSSGGSYTVTPRTSLDELTIGTPTSGTLSWDGDKHYYQINVPTGQHLFLILEKDNSWSSYFYIKYLTLPTSSDYDDRDSGSSDQKVQITCTQTGYYYVIVESNSSSGGTYTILAQSHLSPENPDINYSYDKLGRLKGVTYPSGEQIVYTYDERGNRLEYTVTGGTTPGDANGDGSINVQDVICIINCILDPTFSPEGNPDCNEDGSVNVLDVICVINKILGG